MPDVHTLLNVEESNSRNWRKAAVEISSSSNRNDLQSFSKSARFREAQRGRACSIVLYGPKYRELGKEHASERFEWQQGPSGSNQFGKRPSNYSEARANRCAGDSPIA